MNEVLTMIMAGGKGERLGQHGERSKVNESLLEATSDCHKCTFSIR